MKVIWLLGAGLECQGADGWINVEENASWSDAVVLVGDTLEVVSLDDVIAYIEAPGVHAMAV